MNFENGTLKVKKYVTILSYSDQSTHQICIKSYTSRFQEIQACLRYYCKRQQGEIPCLKNRLSVLLSIT